MMEGMLTVVWLVLTLVLAFGIGFLVRRLLAHSEVAHEIVPMPGQSTEPRTIKDFEKLAQSCVPEAYWSFLSCGTGQELTLEDNVAAYDRYLIRPRYLRNVSDVDMRVTLFGDEIAFPIGLSPTVPYSARGELLTSKACVDQGTWMVLSSLSSLKMEVVAKSIDGRAPIWYNLIAGTKIEICKEHIRRAEKSGFRALVITIDEPVTGAAKQSNVPHALAMSKFPNYDVFDIKVMYEFYFANLVIPSTTWEKIDVIRSLTHLPIILKGILTAEDAIEALKHNVHGIIVSNHGGRQLDGVPATIDVLSEVVSAVDNKVDVFIDGGIRKGTDVLKALALGAKAVFIGRPVIWGLEYNGFEGVKSVLTILRDELKLAMQLSGCANLSDLRKNNVTVVVHESHYRGGCHGRRNET